MEKLSCPCCGSGELLPLGPSILVCRHCGSRYKEEGIGTTVTLADDDLLIAVVFDRSGSMDSLWDEAISGFNKYLKKIKRDLPDAVLSIIAFDDRIETFCNNVRISDMNMLTGDEFPPRGFTSLYDAIGRAIVDNADHAGKAIIVVQTDGEENASKEFSESAIKSLMEKKRSDGWDFTFLTSEPEAERIATNIGTRKQAIGSYGQNRKGVASSAPAMAYAATVSYAVAGAADIGDASDDDDSWMPVSERIGSSVIDDTGRKFVYEAGT